MSTTSRGGLPLVDGPDNRKLVRLDLNALAQALADRGVQFLEGPVGQQPAASHTMRGIVYLADNGAISLCNGQAWRLIAGEVAPHEAASDPHPQYLTAVEGDALFLTPAEGAAAFLGKTAKAADSDLLDGLDSTAFARRARRERVGGAVPQAAIFGNQNVLPLSTTVPSAGADKVFTDQGDFMTFDEAGTYLLTVSAYNTNTAGRGYSFVSVHTGIEVMQAWIPGNGADAAVESEGGSVGGGSAVGLFSVTAGTALRAYALNYHDTPRDITATIVAVRVSA